MEFLSAIKKKDTSHFYQRTMMLKQPEKIIWSAWIFLEIWLGEKNDRLRKNQTLLYLDVPIRVKKKLTSLKSF